MSEVMQTRLALSQVIEDRNDLSQEELVKLYEHAQQGHNELSEAIAAAYCMGFSAGMKQRTKDIKEFLADLETEG